MSDSGNERLADILRKAVVMPRAPRMPDLTSLPIRAKMETMLLACLSGGMAYADAKKVCMEEYGAELIRAEDHDDTVRSEFNKVFQIWAAEKDFRMKNGGTLY